MKFKFLADLTTLSLHVLQTGLQITFNRNIDIWVMNRDGTNLTLHTKNSGFDGKPTLAPDSTKIVSTSDGTGNMRFFHECSRYKPYSITNNHANENEPAGVSH